MKPERDAVLDWLLEPENPSVRYFALRDLLGTPADDPELCVARQAIMERGSVPKILALQHAQGWWEAEYAAYAPMYRSTVWQVTFLAELGADATHVGVQKACEHVLRTVQKEACDFPSQDERYHKEESTDMICLDGMTTGALLRLGYAGDLRLDCSVAFLARALHHGEARCRFNGHNPCAWGMIKALRALASLPADLQTRDILSALRKGAEFLLAGDLAHGGYPTKPHGKVSEHWFRFGFPRGYRSDILQALDVLTELGYGGDPRLKPALDFMLAKRQAGNVWLLEDTPRQMRVALERRGRPSKWITLHALRVLKRVAALPAASVADHLLSLGDSLIFPARPPAACATSAQTP